MCSEAPIHKADVQTNVLKFLPLQRQMDCNQMGAFGRKIRRIHAPAELQSILQVLGKECTAAAESTGGDLRAYMNVRTYMHSWRQEPF